MMSTSSELQSSKANKPSARSSTSLDAVHRKTLTQFFSVARKSSLLKQSLAIIVVVLVLYAFHNIFHNTFLTPAATSKLENAFPSFSSASSTTQENQLNLQGKPVKVYLYDLPKRFTYGVIEHHSLARGGRPDDDVSKLKYPGHQYMGEWYLFQDLLKPESERVGSPVERVLDPEEADLFYVPFFSSLSLIVNSAQPASGSEKLPFIKLKINRERRLVKRDSNVRDCSCLCSNQNGIITSL